MRRLTTRPSKSLSCCCHGSATISKPFFARGAKASRRFQLTWPAIFDRKPLKIWTFFALEPRIGPTKVGASSGCRMDSMCSRFLRVLAD
jgi:hypothetical protein